MRRPTHIRNPACTRGKSVKEMSAAKPNKRIKRRLWGSRARAPNRGLKE